MATNYDVLVIGGGPAGLSAAMALGRMSRSALVCDDARPRNAPASHMNNFPSHDGLPPTEWRELTRQDLKKYETIKLHSGSVESLEKAGEKFHATLTSGEQITARKIILASGVEDQLQLPGLKELWGKSVFHCPYCHGFEVRDEALGLVANGQVAEHLLPMIYSLSKNVTLFTNGPADLSPELKVHLKRREIPLVETKLKALLHEGAALRAVELETGEKILREKLFMAPSLPFRMKSPLGDHLGCKKNEMGLFEVSPRGLTSVVGVFAAGDIALAAHSVLGAAASGQMAGAGAAAELVAEDFRSP